MGQEAPGVVRLARVVIAIDHKALAADIIRLQHLDIILVFKASRVREGQEMALLGQLGQMVVVDALVEGHEMTDGSASALNQVLREAGQARAAAALGNERAQIALDIHAVVLPAIIEVPGRFNA